MNMAGKAMVELMTGTIAITGPANGVEPMTATTIGGATGEAIIGITSEAGKANKEVNNQLRVKQQSQQNGQNQSNQQGQQTQSKQGNQA
jgi:hypothetical protein